MRWIVLWIVSQQAVSVATAQTWRIEPSAKATVTVTNNSGFADSADTGGDVILELAPRVALKGRGPRYTVDGAVEADSLNYVRSTQTNRFIPKATLTANANAVERWVYLDAAAQFTQVTSNPFSAASTANLPSKRQEVRQYRLSPYVDHAFTPSLSLLYRNNNVWSRTADVETSAVRTESVLHGHSFALTQQPLPFGYSLEATQEETEFVNSGQPRVELASARGVLTYALDPTFIVGAVAGAERIQIASSTSRDSIRGLRLRWRPTERTNLDAAAERRFFGTGWNVIGTHRSPFMAISLGLSRQPASQPSTLAANSGGELRSLIDASYSTRFPNPTERAAVVDTVIARLGPLAGGTAPITVFSDYAPLDRNAVLSVAFLSPRSVLTFRLFASESVQLQRPDAPPLPLPVQANDNAQLGGSASLTRRLTSTLSVDAVLSGVKIEGRGAALGQVSTTKSATLSAIQELTPKSRLIAGARRQLSGSNVFNSAQETAAFVGLEQRF